jgi:hypothetical protein
MPCADCIQQAQQKNEAENTILKKAIEMANRSGDWVGIYTDEFGYDQTVIGAEAGKYPIRRWVTPNMQQPSL